MSDTSAEALQDEDRDDGPSERMLCPACPDGQVWDTNGPTGRTCKTCGGHAVVNKDGSQINGDEDE